MSTMTSVPFEYGKIYEPSPASLATESGRLPAELSRRTSSLESDKYSQVQQWSVPVIASAAKESFIQFCTEVLQFNRQDEDDQIARPARDSALAVTVGAYTQLPQKWRRPRIATDGGGGVRLTWKSSRKELRAIFPADAARTRYLYVEVANSEPYLIQNFTATTLSDQFNSL
jgi:hypothetical protein